MRHLVWLRADLRTIDNTALHEACLNPQAEVVAVYAITPGQWREHDVAGCRIDFELRTLQQLAPTLDSLGIPFRIIYAHTFADLPPALLELSAELRIDAVFFNRQYEVNELQRDAEVGQALGAMGVVVHAFHDQCAVAPGRLLTADKRYYSVFTPFKRNWLQTVLQEGLTLRPQPKPRRGSFTNSSPIPASVKGFTSHLAPDVATARWPAGEEAAVQRLRTFCRDSLRSYAGQRDLPAIEGTSTLSPYLAMGAISVRQCLNAAFTAKRESLQGEADIDVWIAELCWRDFYKHVMVGFPRVSRHQPFRLETRPLPWRHDEAAFARWCEGQTGFPIIDAAMRQLREIGWMHNRLRMLVAMFLTKDLFIDWRWGERFFMQHLIDGDLSANNGGWQWCASTGNDAAPYFRVFNPTVQSQRFDADGSFIRRYVPELAGLDGKRIHAPHQGSQLGLFSSYPEPMVDHGEAKDFAVDQFRNLKLLKEASLN